MTIRYEGIVTNVDNGEEKNIAIELLSESPPGPGPDPEPPIVDPWLPQEIGVDGNELQLDLTEQFNANITTDGDFTLLVPKVKPGRSGTITILGAGKLKIEGWVKLIENTNEFPMVIPYYSPKDGVVIGSFLKAKVDE